MLSLIANVVLVGLYFISKNKSSPKKEETTDQKYPYLSKRIFAENQNDILINFIPLRAAMREYVGNQDGKIGVYFEYLPSGISIGVNEKEEVQLSSLSKVPLVMSVYKKIEKDKVSKSDNLTIGKEQLDNKFGNLWQKGEGTSLSVEELINLALVESDNTAYNVLFNSLTPQEINEVYDGLDIEILDEEEFQTVSPKSYSSIFRSLYLSSYLKKEDSNEVLKILTKTPFNDKIVAGVQEDVKVAHKIGVFETLDQSGDVFIDCGIVYIPNRPYTLCMFVRDSNEQAQEHMSHISKMVYGYVARVNN